MQIAIQEAQPPNIDYGENELNIWYNTPEEINQIGEVLPLFDGWDLGDYEIIPGTVDFGIAPAIDNNYPADENFSLDEVTGKSLRNPPHGQMSKKFLLTVGELL